MLDKYIARDFETIDENGDGLVSKQESFTAYQGLGLDRSQLFNNDNNNPDTTYGPYNWHVVEHYVDDIQGGMSVNQRDWILYFATKNRDANDGNLEDGFLRPMRQDLQMEFGGRWNCFWVDLDHIEYEWNLGFGFVIQDDDNNFVVCWKRVEPVEAEVDDGEWYEFWRLSE